MSNDEFLQMLRTRPAERGMVMLTPSERLRLVNLAARHVFDYEWRNGELFITTIALDFLINRARRLAAAAVAERLQA